MYANCPSGIVGFNVRKGGAMPEVFRERGFKFFFYSNEGTPREPVHIHVEKDRMEAKFWLFPQVRVAYNDGYDARTHLQVIVEVNRGLIERVWNEYFG
jgi:Domain of unknown function (DUF4160)